MQYSKDIGHKETLAAMENEGCDLEKVSFYGVVANQVIHSGRGICELHNNSIKLTWGDLKRGDYLFCEMCSGIIMNSGGWTPLVKSLTALRGIRSAGAAATRLLEKDVTREEIKGLMERFKQSWINLDVPQVFVPWAKAKLQPFLELIDKGLPMRILDLYREGKWVLSIACPGSPQEEQRKRFAFKKVQYGNPYTSPRGVLTEALYKTGQGPYKRVALLPLDLAWDCVLARPFEFYEPEEALTRKEFETLDVLLMGEGATDVKTLEKCVKMAQALEA